MLKWGEFTAGAVVLFTVLDATLNGASNLKKVWSGARAVWAWLKRLYSAVIEFFRMPAELRRVSERINALNERLATLERSPMAEAKQKSIPHMGIRWTWSDISKGPVANCDLCFQDHGRLYVMRPFKGEEKTGYTCPSNKHGHNEGIVSFSHSQHVGLVNAVEAQFRAEQSGKL